MELLASLNPLQDAEEGISEDRNPAPQPAPPAVEQAPIIINLEAPKRAGTGPKSDQFGDRTLEALASSRDAITNTPNTNWRSSGANERRAASGSTLNSGQIRDRVQRGRGAGRRPGGGRQR